MGDLISPNLITEIGPSFVGFFGELFAELPMWMQSFLILFSWSMLVVIYAVFIWKFYRWIAKKDILELNRAKFNRYEDSVLSKLVGGALYFVEYIVILPFVVFLWFGVFTIFLILLTNNLGLETILIISVTIVAAIRMTAYYKQDLARDLAKLIPLTLMTVAIVQGIFDTQKILGQISMISNMVSEIWIYILFIIIIEFLLRVLDVIFLALGLSSNKEVEGSE